MTLYFPPGPSSLVPRPFVLLLLLLLAPLPALAEDSALKQFQAKVNLATDSLVRQLEERNPDKKEFTIAAIPLPGLDGQRQPRIGVLVADFVTARMTALRKPWLKIVERMLLPTIHEEHRLWVSGLVRPGGKEGQAPEGLFQRSDFLVIGHVTSTRKEISAQLRVVVTRTGSTAASASVLSPNSPDLRDLFRYVNRDQGGGTRELARVMDAHLALHAQRGGPFGGIAREWKVKEMEELLGGNQFRIEFRVDADAVVYILLLSSDGSTASLFPTKDWEEQLKRQHNLEVKQTDNYCWAEEDYRVPGLANDNKTELFYRLDNTPGRNVLYLVTHTKDVRGVDKILEQLAKKNNDPDRLALLEDKFDFVKTFVFYQKRKPGSGEDE